MTGPCPLCYAEQTDTARCSLRGGPMGTDCLSVSNPLSYGWGTNPHMSIFSGSVVGGCQWTHIRCHQPLHRELWRVRLGPPEKLTGGPDQSISVKEP